MIQLKRFEQNTPDRQKPVPVKQKFTDRLKLNLAYSTIALKMLMGKTPEFIQIPGISISNGEEIKHYSHKFLPQENEIITEVETSKGDIRSRKNIRTKLDQKTINELNKTKDSAMKSVILRMYVESKLGI